MKLRRFLPILVFLLLGAAVLAGLMRTRASGTAPAKAVARQVDTGVDQRVIITAKRLALMPSAPEEKPFAHDALRLADHEVDLAFADALREAAGAPLPATPEVRDLLAAKTRHEESLEEGQRTVAKLTKASAAAREEDKDALDDQLEVAKAQLELDKDELEATGDRLEKLGADPGARIRRLKAAFNAAEQVHEGANLDETLRFQPGSLLQRLDAWYRLHQKETLLAAAQAEALAKAGSLGQRQQDLARTVDQLKEDREAARQQAKGFAHAKAPGNSRATAKATLSTLKHFMENQRTLADLGKRFQDARGLAETYQAWGAFLQIQARAALHLVLQQALWILLVLILVYFADRIFEAVFRSIMAGQKRVGRNLKVVKFGAQVVGALAIIVIVLGTPSQLTTLLGLAGAGLTVALKDFIMSFFGWFILVGPKGIHMGDWVEINGVSGEVVDIGLMRTLLLETGNWSDAGHPTGRVVSFVNSFALAGHFFNFSSGGQWMWDELTVNVPAGEDPYPFMEGIKVMVEERTRENAALAFKEWEAADRGYRVQGLKAEPGINVVPTPSGVEIHVRYITRAQERNELRRDLNEAVVELLHGKHD